jgi:hypothetical protein
MVSGSHDIGKQLNMNLVPITVMMDKIRKGSYRISIEKIREFSAKGDSENVAKWKKNLPYFVYGIIKGTRKAENVVQANGIVLDFDHVADIEAFKQLAAEKIPGAKYVFRSPNDGVKVLVAFSMPVTEKKLYKFIWDALAQEAENLLGVKPDATADMCRACFVSWDAELLTTHNEPLDVEMFRSAVGSDAVPTETDECRFGERHYDVAVDVPSVGVPTDKMSVATGEPNSDSAGANRNLPPQSPVTPTPPHPSTPAPPHPSTPAPPHPSTPARQHPRTPARQHPPVRWWMIHPNIT